jgi:hypothetical protein
MPRRTLLAAAAIAAPCCLATLAEAKPARCFTSDDGEYACEFVATDGEGSFEISAPGRPTFSLVMEAPGVAFGYGDYGSGSVALPGRYLRSRRDPACWVNDETGARLCAW